ncbi:ComF family protein [Marinilabilia sp.]|uniref:ComF family protein n=1 Tax=Marinilabilia sp. TaxID=2021252 RepID=UPI0025BFE184|nr:ComF family protein [Marinilabilia sp.]
MPNLLRKYLSGLSALVFPEICKGCGESLVSGRTALCRKCESEMPRTFFEKVSGNLVEQMFWGRARVEFAFSLFFYRKGELLQQLIHQLKYKRDIRAGTYLGQMTGRVLLKEELAGKFDCIIPVPLHPQKQRLRGYNQSDIIADGISEITKVPVNKESVIRTVHSASQTRRGRYERWQNVEGIFKVVHPHLFHNQHLLILDDVVTTGATIEALCAAFSEVENVRFSVLTIGIAVG